MNETITTETPPLTPREVKLTDSLTRQNEIICSLKQALTAAEKENKRLRADVQDLKEENESLREEYETMKRTVRQVQEVVQMFRVLEDYVRDDVDLMNIGRAVVSYVDLLDRKAVERNV